MPKKKDSNDDPKVQVRKPRLLISKRGVRISKPSMSIKNKNTSVNFGSKGVSTTVRTKWGSWNSRRGCSLPCCSSVLLIPILLLGVFFLISCGGSSFQKWSSQQAVEVLQGAGLEVENPTPMTKDDYGLAPMIATEATRFFIPSLCDDCGGRVFAFENADDLEAMQTYYEKLAEGSAIFFSWVFVKDNILVQINGDMPEEQARQYETALANLK